MYAGLKESKPHGTREYPYTQYHIHKPTRAFHVPVHWHEEMEIIYIKDGNLRISVEGEIFEGVPGEIYLVNPGELHYMETDRVPVNYYTILFPLELVSFQAGDAIEYDFMRPFREKRKLLTHNINEMFSVEKIEILLEEAILLNDKQEGMYQLRTKAKLVELLAELEEAGCFYEPMVRKESKLQRNMISYIQEHYTEKLTLEMLAEEFHLSEKYISRYFKEQFSISFMQYVSHLRMEKAKELLRSTEFSITEVAFSSGYPSVNFFIRSFKEENQITPLQYRKQLRNL